MHWIKFLLFTCLLIVFETAEALARQVTQENFDKGLIYPPFSNIRKISAHIAANVAAKAYELGGCLFLQIFLYYKHQMLSVFSIIYFVSYFNAFLGLATRLPQPENLVKYAESCMYSPVYRSYRWTVLPKEFLWSWPMAWSVAELCCISGWCLFFLWCSKLYSWSSMVLRSWKSCT